MISASFFVLGLPQIFKHSQIGPLWGPLLALWVGGVGRTIFLPRTALGRQVWESVMIDKLSTKPHQCLNLKTEWGQSRTPAFRQKHNLSMEEGRTEGTKLRGEEERIWRQEPIVREQKREAQKKK